MKRNVFTLQCSFPNSFFTEKSEHLKQCTQHINRLKKEKCKCNVNLEQKRVHRLSSKICQNINDLKNDGAFRPNFAWHMAYTFFFR